LPESVVSIEEEAFAGNAAVTELVVPEGVAAIGERAFAESGLTEITLPSTLTSIADDAFDGCDIETAHAPWGSYAFEYCREKGWFVETPFSPEMNVVTYGGEAFKVVNTAADPIVYAGLVRDSVCTSPGGTGKYSGKCQQFCYYYVYCLVDNITDVSVSVALSKYMTSKKLNNNTEKYSDPDAMMARLYDLLNTGAPQILMVDTNAPPGSRHFVAVIGYRASVTRREDLGAEDLLIIDSYDGKLESTDSRIEMEYRRLFKQDGKYRIDAFTWR
ncbi:MAG: leucine-rich repeat domain-containing protein, partial [Clostridia bacterium]|nr:leucine-rich repeat domain-containing protein [Clostridia bacterium]